MSDFNPGKEAEDYAIGVPPAPMLRNKEEVNLFRSYLESAFLAGYRGGCSLAIAAIDKLLKEGK